MANSKVMTMSVEKPSCAQITSGMEMAGGANSIVERVTMPEMRKSCVCFRSPLLLFLPGTVSCYFKREAPTQ